MRIQKSIDNFYFYFKGSKSNQKKNRQIMTATIFILNLKNIQTKFLYKPASVISVLFSRLDQHRQNVQKVRREMYLMTTNNNRKRSFNSPIFDFNAMRSFANINMLRAKAAENPYGVCFYKFMSTINIFWVVFLWKVIHVINSRIISVSAGCFFSLVYECDITRFDKTQHTGDLAMATEFCCWCSWCCLSS